MTNIFPTGLSNMDKENLLLAIHQQLDNYPTLGEFISRGRITPSVIFLPQTLRAIAEELSRNTSLVIDCFNLLDVVNMYSLLVFEDVLTIYTEMSESIVSIRTIDNINKSLEKEAMDDFYFTNKEDMLEFLHNNKYLVAMYIYSLVYLMFYDSK